MGSAASIVPSSLNVTFDWDSIEKTFTLPILKNEKEDKKKLFQVIEVLCKIDIKTAIMISSYINNYIKKQEHKEEEDEKIEVLIAEQAAAARTASANQRLEITSKQEELDELLRLEKEISSDYPEIKEATEKKKQELQNARSEANQLETQYLTLRKQTKEIAVPEIRKEEQKYKEAWNTFTEKINDEELNNLFKNLKIFCPNNIDKPIQPIENDKDNTSAEYFGNTRKNAKKVQNELSQILLPFSEINDVQLSVPSSIKSVGRCLEKGFGDYQGNMQRIVDLSRGSIVCNTFEALYNVINNLQKMKEDGIIKPIRMKNRIENPTPAGYRDLMFNLILPKIMNENKMITQHICELQLHIREFYKIKNGKGHKLYELARMLDLLRGNPINKIRNHYQQYRRQSKIDLDASILTFGTMIEQIQIGELVKLDEKHLSTLINEDRIAKFQSALISGNVHTMTFDLKFLQTLMQDNPPVAERLLKVFEVKECIAELKDINKFLIDGEAEETCDTFTSFFHDILYTWAKTSPSTSKKSWFGKINQEKPTVFVNALIKGKTSIVQKLREMQCDVMNENLNLENKKIGNEGIKALAEALKVNQTLQNLNLERNNIGVEGIKALTEALKVNQTLQNLHLYHNKIPIFEIKLNSISELDLSRGGIGDSGAIILASLLNDNQSLQNLNLHYNGIGVKGGKALAETLKVNQTLQNLNLERNNIGNEGIKALAETLKVNQTLQNLNLYNNNIGDEGSKALVESLKVNQTLQNLNLRDNKIGDVGIKALVEKNFFLQKKTFL